MSKTKVTHVAPPTRKQLSRFQRERLLQTYIWAGTLAVVIIVVGLVGFGLLDQYVLQQRRPVASVNGVEITTADFQKAVRYRRFQMVNFYLQYGSDPQLAQLMGQQLQQIQSQLSDVQGLGQQILDELVSDQLVRQEAARRKITVSSAEVDARLREFFNYFPNGTATPTITPTPFPTDVLSPTATLNPVVVAQWTPTPTITPTATLTPTATNTPGPSPTVTPTGTPTATATPFTAQAFATRSADYVTSLKGGVGMNQADLRYFIESSLYKEKLIKAMAADLPTTGQRVHARHILVKEEAEAKAVLARLKAGTDWDALAAEYSTDTSNSQKGGDLGWFGPGQMVAEFEKVAFNTPVGTISDPVQTQFGWHIIQVLGKETRPLTQAELDQAAQKAFDDWVQKQRAATGPDGKKLLVETFDLWKQRVPDTPALPAGVAPPVAPGNPYPVAPGP